MDEKDGGVGAINMGWRTYRASNGVGTTALAPRLLKRIGGVALGNVRASLESGVAHE